MMIWILLAAVGVPLWLVVGALAAGLWSRRNFKKSPGVFRAKAQQMSPEQTAVDWSHLKVYGRWVHDVLLLHQGLALVRNRALPVRRLTPSTLDPSTVRGLGDHPIIYRVELDGGQIVVIASPAEDRQDAQGPFASAMTNTN